MSNNKDFKVKNGIKPTVYHEAVTTVTSENLAYSIVGASYDSKSFSIAAQEISVSGIALSSDGTEAYIIGSNTDSVQQYSLSTAWDISTASYLQNFSVASQETGPTDLIFKPDGTKMYITGVVTDAVHQYTLSTAWDISTASYDSVSFGVLSQEGTVQALAFGSNGTKMYISGSASDTIHQYTLSTAWDISTASYDSVGFSVASQEQSTHGIAFKPDGTKMYITGVGSDAVNEYTLSTAWDVSTASYTTNVSVLAQDTTMTGVYFKPDGTKMYLCGDSNDTIYQYSTTQETATLDLSTGSVFEITPTSDIQVTLSNPADSGTVSGATLLLDGVATSTYDIANAIYDSVSFSVAAQDTNPAGVTFKPDGTKMYVVGGVGDDVNEYDLSAAWDISTASYLQAFSVATQDTGPVDVQFKSDGTKMYVVGNVNDRVYQYSLSTAWDVSTASYDSVFFSLTSQGTSPFCIFFKPDGTSFYTIDYTPDTIFKYDLSTAWDLSTASYSGSSFTVNAQDTAAFGFSFKPDGTKLYVVGSTGDDINQYSLSTAWDITTASFDNITFSVVSQDNVPRSMFWKSDGTKMYVLGDQTDTIYQYSTATPATITYDTSIQWAGGTAPTSPAIGETDVVTFTTRDGGTSYSAALAIDGAQ